MIETREGDKPGVWHSPDALFCSGVKAVSLTDIQQTRQRHIQQELFYASEAAWRPQGGDKRFGVVSQQPRFAVGARYKF